MKWQEISSADPVDSFDRPRKLTDEEINYVTSHLPLTMGAETTATDMARDGIVTWLTSLLQTCELCPSALSTLKDRLIEAHYRSLVVPGTPVGITAAESVSAVTMQMTLNTFHSSGSSKSVTGSIDTIRDLIFARTKPKNPSCTIHYRDKRATYRQILDSRKYIVGSTFMDFVKDYSIYSSEELPRYWWHQYYPEGTGKAVELTNARRILRLTLDTEEMYRHQVPISKLAEILRREYSGEGTKAIPLSVVPVFGPFSDGIIDVFPTASVADKAIRELFPHTGNANQDLVEMVFLETIVIPCLKTVRVKGIPGITRIYPVVVKVWDLVMREETVADSDYDDYYRNLVSEEALSLLWILNLSPSVMTTTGLGVEDLHHLCSSCGITIMGISENNLQLFVSLPDNQDESPSKRINRLLAEEGASFTAGEELLQVDSFPLKKASEYVYSVTDGIGEGFLDLLALPEIDKSRTTCNNMYVIASAFGIEAARNFLVKQLMDSIANSSSYINPANVTTIAELITSRGEPSGATYSGISRQPFGHLSLATLERAGKVFIQAALFSKHERELGVSARIAVGSRCAIGDGSFDIGCIDPENESNYLLNEDVFTAYSRNISSQEVEERDPEVIPLTNTGIEAYELEDFDDNNILGESEVVSGAPSNKPLSPPREKKNVSFARSTGLVESLPPPIPRALGSGLSAELLELLPPQFSQYLRRQELSVSYLLEAAPEDEQIGVPIEATSTALPRLDDIDDWGTSSVMQQRVVRAIDTSALERQLRPS